MFSNKRILICPLNWGLGHATRCIPIIRLLLQKNAYVIIAADGRPLELLKKEFPGLEFITLNGYAIHYPDKGSMILKMILSLPRIFSGIYAEHNTIKKIIKEKKIDIIISDNRFGCWNKKIRSIFITHQLMIKTPFAEQLLHRLNLYFIKKYDECWVPDFSAGNNLSGDLAHKYPLTRNTFFIGPLSRFRVIGSEEPADSHREKQPLYDIMAIISGPEPQRSIFEKIIRYQLKQSNLKALVVLGKTELESKTENFGNTEAVSHLKTDEMQSAILNSKIIIARSGYSTIMDLATLGKKAIFVPTPGQTEQEYLAGYLMSKNIAYSVRQERFDLTTSLKNAEGYKGFEGVEQGKELEERISDALSEPYSANR